MLVIRLARIGRKNRPAFRIVLQEKTQAPKSASKETLGSYNPLLPKREDQVKFDKERIMHWLKLGAEPSATVHNMLVEFKVIEGKKQRVVGTQKKSSQAAAAEKEAKK